MTSENKSPTSKLTEGDTDIRGTYDLEGNENKSRARTIVDYLDDYENLRGPCIEEKKVIELRGDKEQNIIHQVQQPNKEVNEDAMATISSLINNGKSTWKMKAREATRATQDNSNPIKRKTKATSLGGEDEKTKKRKTSISEKEITLNSTANIGSQSRWEP